MEKTKTAMFIGHRDCHGLPDAMVEHAVKEAIEKGITTFLNGGMGDFDLKCARIVQALKHKYPDITSYLIIPYLTFRIDNRQLFDSIICPDGFEHYHFKAAIPARNKYLIQSSSYAICYIAHGWGGAAQTFQMARRAGLSIINLYDLHKA